MPLVKLLAGAPISAENSSAYSPSNFDHGMSSARITHRFWVDNFPSNGSLNSPCRGVALEAGRYMVFDLLPDGDARFLGHFTPQQDTCRGLFRPQIPTLSAFRSFSASPN